MEMRSTLIRRGVLTCDLAATRIGLGADVKIEWGAPHPNVDADGALTGDWFINHDGGSAYPAFVSIAPITDAGVGDPIALSDDVVISIGDALATAVLSVPLSDVVATLYHCSPDDIYAFDGAAGSIGMYSQAERRFLRSDTVEELGWPSQSIAGDVSMAMQYGTVAGFRLFVMAHDVDGEPPVRAYGANMTYGADGSTSFASGAAFASVSEDRVPVIDDQLVVVMDDDSESWGSDGFKTLVVPFQDPPHAFTT